MDIKFNSNLDYQLDAINSIVNLFKGQPVISSRFSLSTSNILDTVEGQGNKFNISFEDIKKNFQNVQESNDLDINEDLKSLDFTIEMETGTGKTYVYLRTILELYQNYGFSKFVIVVPSIAIKEGVKKTLDITRHHFKDVYNNISYSDFVFDSNNLTQLEDFAREDNIQIMIINIDSFNRERNKIRQRGENGIIPMDYIIKTNPIVIIDEPQSVLGGKDGKGRQAISDLDPLFTLQYSATPKDVDNLVYKLDAIDAYNSKLVKKIEVDAFDSADYQNTPYMQLDSTKLNKKSGERTAKFHLIKNTKTGLKKELSKSLKIGDKLDDPKISNNDAYKSYEIEDIICSEDNEHVLFTSGEKIKLGQIKHDINQEEVKKVQIKETIREHLNKELKLAEKNIKVLSLFFIDYVPNYRDYNAADNKGKYALWFEEAYDELINEENYQKLPDYIKNVPTNKVHDGYFSIDNKKWADTTGRTTKDNTTYEKIMKDKEKLLDPKDNLRFIFSHSALKEGWDNPNVFQICTLIETQSDLSKRQKIGRGLRLCVNGDGTRIDKNYGEEFENINRLTVLANESFDNFASSLQKEMEENGIKFARITKKDLKRLTYTKDNIEKKISDYDASSILRSLLKQNIINKDYQVTKEGYNKVANSDFYIPSDYESIEEVVATIITNKSSINYISNKKDKITITLNKDKLNEPAFINLWDKIKYKTRYSVDIDTEKLISSCVIKMGKKLKNIQKTKITHTKTTVVMKNEVTGITRTKRSHFIESHHKIPNIVKNLQDKTHLTRDTIIEILRRSNRRDKTFEKLLINPSEYFNITLEIILDNLHHMAVDKIKYYTVDGQEFYVSEFAEEFTVYVEDDDFIKSKIVPSEKSLYDYIRCDSSTIEVPFAKELESKEDIKFFMKLPDWFKIETPLGTTYNPDWGITVEVNGKQETYFVIETKGDTKSKSLRGSEEDKIECGRKHFEVLPNVDYDVCVNYDEFAYKHIHD